jgi:hypothetical protein
MLIAWRICETVPWLLFSQLSSFFASTLYHTCYSFGVCILTEPLYHRHLDHFCSTMYAIVLSTTFLWRKRPIPMDPTDEYSEELSENAEVGSAAPRNRLEFYRPWVIDPLIFALYVVKAYIQIQQGLFGFNFRKFFAGAMLVIAALHVGEIYAFGLKLRSRSLLIYMVVMSIAYAYFLGDESLGAVGHSISHVIGFSIGWPYLRYGPIFCDKDGTAYAIRFN